MSLRDLRTFPPVAESVERPEKLSQTSLSKFDTCPRSFYLYLRHRNSPQSHPMARGECWHEFRERFIGLLVDSDERMGPPEVAKDLMNTVIAERKDLVLPAHEQHALRGMAWNFATATAIDPEQIVGLEQMLELKVGDWTIRGRLDFAEITPFGALICDDKTSLAIPSADELENGAKSFQGRFYCLLFAYGIPEGEDLPLGEGINQFRFRTVYPRFTNSETGELVYREVTYERDYLSDFRQTVTELLDRIDHGFETGEWPASPGSHCHECPCRAECPIPEQHHENLEIASLEDAVALAQTWYTRDLANSRLKRSLRAFAEDQGEPIFFGDYALAFRHQESRKVDWDAIDRGSFDPVRDVSLVSSTPFVKRKVTPEERAERNGG